MKDKEKIIQNLTNEIFDLKEKLQKISIELIVKDTEIERLKQDYDEVWEDTYFSVKEDFELNNNCNECRRYYAEEFNKQLAEKDRAIEGLEELNKSLGNTCNNDLKEIERLREQLAEKDKEIEELKEITNSVIVPKRLTKIEMNKLIKQQTLTAIIELEKAKKFFILCLKDKLFGEEKFEDYIDNQIKQLKEGK